MTFLCGFKQTQKMMLGVSENGLYPWLAASELGFFFGSASWWKLEIPPFHDNGGHYPLVMTNIAIENGPVEIVDLASSKMVDLSSSLCGYVYQARYQNRDAQMPHMLWVFWPMGQSLLIPPKLRTCAWKWGTKESHNCHGSETGDFYPFLSIFGYP